MRPTVRDLLDLARDRIRVPCPVCGTPHLLTSRDRLWTHGPRGRRCRGSQRTLAGARVAARDVRGGAS